MDDFEKHLAEQLETDPEFKKVWEEMRPIREFQHALIRARLEAGLTQEELGKLMGMEQSAIARIERGSHLPNLETILRLAEALKIEVTIRPDRSIAITQHKAA